MFTSLKRIVYYVPDVEEAKSWYTALLQVKPIFDTPSVAIFQVANCSLSIVKGNPPNPEIPGLPETYWEVEDVDKAFNRLTELGAKVHSTIREILNIKTARVLDPFGNVIGITGNAFDSQTRSVENQPSETAMTVAFCRALAFADEREEIRGADSLAHLFLREEAKPMLTSPEKRRQTIQYLVTSPLYGYFTARTKFFDEVFARYLSERIGQIVLLGAGYDTRAIRFRDLLSETQVFELDIRPTQHRKVEILRREGIEIPGQLVFSEINFKTDRLEEVLKNAGFNPAKRTLFLWEGVVYYLDREVVAQTLETIRKISPEGSIICFDYLKERLESVNPAEPFKFWIKDAEIEAFLRDLGIRTLQQVDPSMMEKQYLTLQNGETGEKVLSQFNFLEGEISPFRPTVR